MDKPKSVKTNDLASWDPYGSPPDGLRVENLRRRGLDIIRFDIEKPHRQNQFLFYFPIVIALPIIFWAVYASQFEIAVFFTAALSVFLDQMSRAPRVKRWTFSLSPEYLGVQAETGSKASSVARRITFGDIKGIDVSGASPAQRGPLAIQTLQDTIEVGHELPKDVKSWLKNRLIMEVAGLTWRPLFGINRSQSKSRSHISSNPVLLENDLASRLISIFSEQAPEYVERLGAAIAEKNVDEMRHAAHWLKSASANVGAKHLSDQCQLMQLYAMDRNFARTDILFKEIKATNDSVIVWLQSIRDAATQIADVGSADIHPSIRLENDRPAATSNGEDSESADTPGAAIIDAKVLVVDDSAVSRLVAEECLSTVVSNLSFAEDGQKALDLIANEQFDLIISDCEMENMDGYEFARQLRIYEHNHDCAPTPVIALTAHALQRDRARCIEAGMDDYLSKPFTFDELEQKVRCWLINKATVSEDTSYLASAA